MRRSILVLLMALVATASRAEDRWTIAISGEVRAGESFAAELPDGLVFALDATPQTDSGPQGWTISVRKSDRPPLDLVWPANPPYRFDNVRYLDTGYGKTPDEMLRWNPRQFYFYDDPAAAEAAERWVRAVLWPSGDEDPGARPDPRGIGVLTVLDSRIGSVGDRPSVVWMRFEVRLSADP